MSQLVQIRPKDQPKNRTFSQLLAAAFADIQSMSERRVQMHGTLLLNTPFCVLLALYVLHNLPVSVTAMLITPHLPFVTLEVL